MALKRCIAALVALVLLAVACDAQEYSVGPWNLSRKKEDYKAWAAGQTFLPGQTLKFEFESGHSVYELATQEAYNNCDLSNPVKTYTQANPVITLGSEGKHFYVCGVGRHCDAGMKVVINVVSSADAASPPAEPPQKGFAVVTAAASSALVVALGAVAAAAIL